METGRPAAGPNRFSGGRTRVAACTALALAAGMLLAAPAAHADDAPVPLPSVERPVPGAGEQQPTSTLKRSPAKRGAISAQDEGAPLAAPRSDVNGDGWSDLISQGLDGSVWVHTFDGNNPSVLGLHDPYDGTSAHVHKDIFSVAGLRSDGPVHFTLSSTGRLTAFANDTTYPSAYWSGTGWQQFNKVFSPGDLTGDGVGDVLARNHAGELFLYRATPGASAPLASKAGIGGGWAQYDQLAGVNDVNNDGIADLFARTPAGELFFYSGTGNASRPFEARVKVGDGWQIFNTLFSLDDFTEDGNAELMARAANGDLYTYVSTGTGKFLPRTKFGSDWHFRNQFANAGNIPAWGKNEVFGVDGSGTLWWYYDRNNGTLAPRQKISDTGGWKGAKITVASSLNDDSYADLLQIYNGHLYNYDIDNAPYDLGGGWGQFDTVLGAGDLSGDGKGDLVTRNSAGELFLHRGNGNGTGFASKLRVGSGWGQFNVLTGAGDISGDGRGDLIARARDGRLYLYEGTGVSSAPFRAKKLIGSGWGQFGRFAVVSDMTGDGRADLLARASDGTMYRYDADGRGNFKPRVKLGPGWNTYSSLF
ncbi:FG-GAP-like repeat-containing protein [Streptomyces sp. t39]|uniref:FG-GAP-like repeat-containing protein n=1 Tax=Streptomyces sp. t39 TaxID=1828156 RepID=UPI0021C5AC4D|nr:FG-GAP-like repeat-containing protein [Streptomyces sp. t39]